MANTLHDLFEREKSTLSPDERRFLLDLEFVQCLANPGYLKLVFIRTSNEFQVLALHESKFFDDERFVQYLKYLLYWKEPEYCKFITYPHSLFMLDALQHEEFRSNLKLPSVISCIYEQQQLHWKHYRLNRTKTKAKPDELAPLQPPATS